jgi:small subunit ribosomal protein S1
MDNLTLDFKPGQKIQGEIVAIDKKTIFVDVNSTSEGVLNREELLDKDGKLKVRIGDSIEAYYVDSDDEGITLTVKMSGDMGREHLDEAYANKIPVIGKVMAERKGGYSVKLAGSEAFCPYSQMDLFRNDNAHYVGTSYPFIITELNSRNLVVSRRSCMLEELDKRWSNIDKELHPGQIIEGQVLKIMKFGVFVDIGGLEGFIPISELTWGRTDKIEDLFNEGDKIRVMIKEIKQEERKISLSYRSAATPWEDIEERYLPGSFCEGTVTRLEHFGAFVELEPGVEGLIHISKVGQGRRINHPREILSIGEAISIKIEDLDSEKNRISLSIQTSENTNEVSATPSPAAPVQDPIEISEGMTLKGIVDGIKPYGIFVRLNKNKSGLLHISQFSTDGNSVSINTLSKKYKQGDAITVVVQEMKDGKISLTTPEKQSEQKAKKLVPKEFTDKSSNSFGSLEDMLSDFKF